MIDDDDGPLEQFWIEHPEYAAAPKEEAEYGISYIPLAASAVQQYAFFTADKDSDFIMTSVAGITVTPGTLANTLVPITVLFIDVAEGRNINDIPVDMLAIVGGSWSSAPGVQWPWPIIVRSGTQFATIVDNPNATAYNLYFAFQGMKVLLPS